MENGVTGNIANRTLAIARQRVFGIGPGTWDNGPINLKKNTETANWSLRQGDEEVNKKYMFKQNAHWIFRFENKPFSGAKSYLAPEEGLFSNRNIGQFV